MKTRVFAATFGLLAALVLILGVPATGIAKDQRGVEVTANEPVHSGCIYVGGQWICW